MKQLIEEYAPPMVEPITIKEMYSRGIAGHDSVIAYVTTSGTGLAILVEKGNGNYGFVYHRDAVLRNCIRLKYECTTKTGSLRKAIQAGKSVYLFETFNEFVKFAADRTKL